MIIIIYARQHRACVLEINLMGVATKMDRSRYYYYYYFIFIIIIFCIRQHKACRLEIEYIKIE